MEQVVFYIFCSIVLLSATFILFTKNVMYAAFALLLTFTGIAGIYIFLMADVVAVAQLMIYVGGILILLIFGVMFTAKGQRGAVLTQHQYLLGGGLAGLSLFVCLGWLMMETNFEKLSWIAQHKPTTKTSTIQEIGVLLMTDQVLALELVGILLLLALVGSTLVAGKK